MYEVIFSDSAKKQLSLLEPSVRDRIGSAIERIKIRPLKFAKRLYNSPHYRVRVDNYRIILDILETKLIIRVLEIGTRDRIYKNL